MDCLICQENILKTGYGVSIECGHVFHGKCLMNWRNSQQTCPTCRSEFSIESIHTLYLANSEIDEHYKFEIPKEKEKDDIFIISNEVELEIEPPTTDTPTTPRTDCKKCMHHTGVFLALIVLFAFIGTFLVIIYITFI